MLERGPMPPRDSRKNPMLVDRTFDDLARRLATPIPRRRALQIGGAALGLALVPMRTRVAFAGHTTTDCAGLHDGTAIECTPDTEECFQRCCPTGSLCCLTPPPCPRVACCDPCYDKCDEAGRCTDKGDPPHGKCPDGSCCKTGEMCCSRTFSFNAATCCSPQDEIKNACKDAEIVAIGLGIVAGTVAAVATGGTALAFFAIGATTGAGVGGLGAKLCGDDPPDPDYTGGQPPVVLRMPRVKPGSGISRSAARAINRMLENQARTYPLIVAMVQAAERAQGALIANRHDWVRIQQDAAAKYARQAAEGLERDIKLRRAAREKLEASDFRDRKVSRKDIERTQRRIRSKGFPSDLRKEFRRMGIEDAQIAAYRREFVKADAEKLAGTGVLAMVSNRTTAKATADLAKSLRKFGREVKPGA